MTQKVSPSVGHTGSAFETASAIRYGGASPGWIVPDTEANLSLWDDDLADGPYNAYVLSASSSSLTVTVESGEGYVNGAWVAKDQPTELAPADQGGLDASTANQIIYLGWALFASDRVKIGTEELFGEHEPRIPIWQASTNATGVTSVTDLRPVGQYIDVQNQHYDAEFDGTGVVNHAETADTATTATTAGHADTADFATNADHSTSADVAEHATSATTAQSADEATTASQLDGRWASEVARDTVSLNFPVANVEAGEKYQQVERVPSGETFRLLGVTLMTDSGGAHSNMQFRVMTTGGSTVYSTSSKSNSGSLPSPLTSFAGAGDLLIGIHNTASSTDYRASARCNYLLD